MMGEHVVSRDIPSEKSGLQFLHCRQCIDDIKSGKAGTRSPAAYASLSVAFTEIGLQVWCERHQLNVIHIDFERMKHPAAT